LTLDYTKDDVRPIPIDLADGSGLHDVIAAYEDRGFAVFSLDDRSRRDSASALRSVAAACDLGEPLVPQMYRASNIYEQGLNRIGRRSEQPAEDHPAFFSTDGQELHSDGTLEPIGRVPTSILLCEAEALRGGATTIFNVVGAFTILKERDPEAAEALLTACLRRTATVGTVGETHLGPAFAERDGEIISRYSVTATDSWEARDCDPTVLARGVQALEEMAEHTGLFTEVKLRAGEGLMLANDHVSHGRRPYVDGEGRTRRLVRGLYLRRPSLA
jgi:hypothetical protein